MRSHVKLLVLGAMLLLIAVFTTALAQADFVVDGTTYDESVLTDHFTGAALDGTKWVSYTRGPPPDFWGGVISTDGVSTLTIDSTTVSLYSSSWGQPQTHINAKTAFDFSASPTDWAAEIKFQLSENPDGGYFGTGPETASGNRAWYIFSGTSAASPPTLPEAGYPVMQGFDLRAQTFGTRRWQLTWWGYDDAVLRLPALISDNGGEGFAFDTSYTIGLHRKTDGNVDIYMDGSLVGTKALIGGANPVGLTMGDWVNSYCWGIQKIDSVKIGVVPEPSTLALLATGLLGLLAYAWRKRK